MDRHLARNLVGGPGLLFLQLLPISIDEGSSILSPAIEEIPLAPVPVLDALEHRAPMFQAALSPKLTPAATRALIEDDHWGLDGGVHDPRPVDPFGSIAASTSSRHTFYDLISTMNASFPDYEFNNTKPQQFVKEPSLISVIHAVDLILQQALPEYEQVPPGAAGAETLCKRLWKGLDGMIELEHCVIYRYVSEPDADPFGEEDVLYSFNYFFVNAKLKRIAFYTFIATSQSDDGMVASQFSGDVGQDFFDDGCDLEPGDMILE